MSKSTKNNKRIVTGTRSDETPLYVTELLVEVENNPNIIESLTDEEKDRIFSISSRMVFSVGDSIFCQHDPHEGIFLIAEGKVRTFYISPRGREITLAYWPPGHFVGGPEVFGGGYHVWSAEAVEPTVAHLLRGQQLRQLIYDVPALSISIIEGLVYKGKCYSELLQLLGTRSASGRLAHLMLMLGSRIGIPNTEGVVINRSFTHDELANMVGTTRQWVTKTLHRFQGRGLIIVRDGRFILVDPKRLQEISQ